MGCVLVSGLEDGGGDKTRVTSRTGAHRQCLAGSISSCLPRGQRMSVREENLNLKHSEEKLLGWEEGRCL